MPISMLLKMEEKNTPVDPKHLIRHTEGGHDSLPGSLKGTNQEAIGIYKTCFVTFLSLRNHAQEVFFVQAILF